jgi:hypothetical protein
MWLRLTTHQRIVRSAFGAVALICVLAWCPGAEAGFINGFLVNDTTALDRGKIEGLVGDMGLITAKIEYAVYYQTAFGQTFPGRYIYAYQIFNDASSGTYDQSLRDFTVGLDGDEQVANLGYFADPTSPPPSPVPKPPSTWSNQGTSALWVFGWPTDQGVLPSGRSQIVYYTSPFPPERANSQVTSEWDTVTTPTPGSGATDLRPFSPVPEPPTWGLLAVGLIFLLFLCNFCRLRVKCQ